MSRNQNPQHNPQNHQQLDSSVIAEILANQKQQLSNEAAKIKLREKELEQNAQLAAASMKYNSDLLRNAPWEHRKNMRTYALIVGVFMVAMLAFIAYCLYSNHEEFVLKFLQLIAYVVVTGIGYFAGVQRGKRVADEQKRNEIEEADIIN